MSRLEINNLVFSQDALDYSEIAKAQQEDEYIKKLLNQSVETGMKLKEYPIEESNLTLLCDISTTKVRPILPVKFQKIVFHKIHDLSHPGIKVSKDLIQQRFVWYGMKKNITNWDKTCLTCQKGKVLKHNKAPLQRFTLPSTRFSEDRVKACQDADDPAPDENETDDQQKNDIVIQTRSGRVVNKPFRFRNYYE